MAKYLSGSQAIAINVFQALNGQAPSNSLLTSYVTNIGTTNGFAWANSLAPGVSVTDSVLATRLLTNLGITATSLTATTAWPVPADTYTALQLALTNYLTAAGVANRGTVVVQLAEIVSNLEGDGVYGTAATAYNAQAYSDFNYASVATNTTPAAVSAVNTAVALTTGTDTLTGTAGNDTFTGAAATWTVGDKINGGAGTDTLNVTVTGTAPQQSATSLVAVEVLNLTASPNPASVDLTGVTGLTDVNNLSSANGATVTVTGLGNLVNTTITGSQTATTITYTTAAVASTTADAMTATLSTVAAGSSLSVAGIENLTLKSTTAANTLSTLTDAALIKLTITGDQALTIGNTTGGALLTTVDASATTGAVTLSTGNGPALTGVTVTGPTAAAAFDVTTGSGKDTVTLGAGASTVNTGSGADTITTGAGANLVTPGTGNDALTLGAGVDTIRYAEAGATNADTIAGFGATDVIAVNLGAAATATANASANATFGTIQTGGTSPVESNVGGTGTGTAISFQAIAPNATATVGTVLAASNVVALNGAYTDGTAAGVITALGTSADVGITTTATGKFLLVTYSVGNIAQVWAFAGDSVSDTNITAAELSLVATLNGVAQNALTAANFATYLTPVVAATTVSNGGQTIALTGLLNTVQSTANTAGQYLTAANDTVTVAVGTLPTAAATATSGLVLLDPSSTDADVFSATVLGDWAAGSLVSGFETINLNMLVAGTTFNASAKTPGTTAFNATGSQNLSITGAVSGTAFGLGAGYTGNFDITPVTAPTAAYTLNLNGTAGTSAATSPTFTVTTGAVITALTINANAATTVNLNTNTTEFATGTFNGSGNVTVFDTSANFGAANIRAVAPAYTGALTFRPSDSAAMDFTATGTVTGLAGIDYSDNAADAVAAHTITVSAAASGGNSLTITDNPATARDSAIQNFTLVQAGTSLADSVTFNFGAKTTPVLTGAITAATTETININYSGTDAGTAFSVVNVTTAAALGTQTVNVSGTGAFTLGVVTADNLSSTGVGSTGSISATLANGTAGAVFTGGAGPATIIGSTVADQFTGGAGADTFRNTATGAGVTAADRMTGGAGADTYILNGDVASGTAVTIYATAPNITDFSISGANGIDVLQLSATKGNYATVALTNFNGTVAAAAAGSTVVMGQAVNGGAVAITAGTDIIKLTTATAATGTLQQLFDAAIGTGTVTGIGVTGQEIFFTVFDSTNLKMVVGIVDSDPAAGGDTAIGTGDTVTLIGTVDMTAANYALFTNANFSIIAA